MQRTRRNQITAAAGILADMIRDRGTYNDTAYADIDYPTPEDAAVAEARDINQMARWVLVTSGAMQHTIQHDGVRFTPTELDEVIRVARRWLTVER